MSLQRINVLDEATDLGDTRYQQASNLTRHKKQAKNLGLPNPSSKSFDNQWINDQTSKPQQLHDSSHQNELRGVIYVDC
eukprot:scaffold156359_cov60-Cyclotella_meneghiniana.AAC.1